MAKHQFSAKLFIFPAYPLQHLFASFSAAKPAPATMSKKGIYESSMGQIPFFDTRKGAPQQSLSFYFSILKLAFRQKEYFVLFFSYLQWFQKAAPPVADHLLNIC